MNTMYVKVIYILTRNYADYDRNKQLTEEKINLLYEFGQFEFDCGSYGSAADMLYHFSVLVCSPESPSTPQTHR